MRANVHVFVEFNKHFLEDVIVLQACFGSCAVVYLVGYTVVSLARSFRS